MSRKNYRHNVNTMDSLIGKPFYSNAVGAVLDPNTGVELAPIAPIGESIESHLNPLSVSMEGINSPDLSTEQIRQGASPEISQAEIDAAKVAQFKANQEMGKRVAEKEAMLKAEVEANRIAEAQRLAQIEAQKAASLSTPIVVSTTNFPSGGGGGFGGGGGGEPEPSAKPSAIITAKPSFLKKNFVPLLLVAGAIFVFIKKPIK
jgi:hypothetical protein